MRKFVVKTLKSFVDKLEKKSANLDTLDNVLAGIHTAYGIGYTKGIGWLSCLGAINYYNRVAPIANAVDLISQKASEIYVSIWDKQEGKYLKDTLAGTPAKVAELLKRCDYDKTYTEYIVAQASYYLITGNAFFITQFTQNGEPVNLLLAKPQDITIIGSGTSIAQKYLWKDGNRNITFTVDMATHRYYGQDANGFVYEIKHLKRFNPKAETGNLWGQSALVQVYLEMEQYISGAVHNNKLLKSGARPSGVLTLDEEMSDDAYEKARAEVNNFYSGAENAGNVLIFEGQGSRFDSFNISPRDMDFVNLSKNNKTEIYNRLNIPMPFVSDSAMTYNNLSESLYQLYILAVIPLIEMIFETMTDLILYRYKDGERYEIHYDEMDIDVMAKRKREEDANTIRLGITTYNEARGMFSLEKLEEGGDDVFISPMLAPLGQPVEKNEEEPKKTPTQKPKTTEEDFKRIMRKQNYDEKYIDEVAEKIYGSSK